MVVRGTGISVIRVIVGDGQRKNGSIQHNDLDAGLVNVLNISFGAVLKKGRQVISGIKAIFGIRPGNGGEVLRE